MVLGYCGQRMDNGQQGS